MISYKVFLFLRLSAAPYQHQLHNRFLCPVDEFWQIIRRALTLRIVLARIGPMTGS
jgi:hypothetical protein